MKKYVLENEPLSPNWMEIGKRYGMSEKYVARKFREMVPWEEQVETGVDMYLQGNLKDSLDDKMPCSEKCKICRAKIFRSFQWKNES